MIPDLQAYHYDGPAEFHAIVGQIMAYLGYAGGHEPLPVGSEIVLKEVEGSRRQVCPGRMVLP